MNYTRILIGVVPLAIVYASLWRVFTKAGRPGWDVIIPIFNIYCLLKIAGKPWWWLILWLIPYLGVVPYVISIFALAQRFGKGIGFAVGLSFLPFIFYPILAFGKAQYQPTAT